MNKLESVQENEDYRFFGDFEIQTAHLILARRPDLESTKKKEHVI